MESYRVWEGVASYPEGSWVRIRNPGTPRFRPGSGREILALPSPGVDLEPGDPEGIPAPGEESDLAMTSNPVLRAVERWERKGLIAGATFLA